MGKIVNKLNRLLGYFKVFWHSLFIGMKNADALMTTSQTNNDASGYELPENGGGGVYKDLLEQKVTQEVEELRYVSYHVAKESKKYRYVGNGNAIKKSESQLKERHVKVDESDNLEIVLIQDNNIVCEDVFTTLKEVDKKENKKGREDFIIKIERDLVPRFHIEDYVRKVVVKDAGENYVLDLYCSKYPRQFNEKKDKAFISEVKKIKNGLRNSDVLDFSKISWVTTNTWGADDWLHYSFNEFEYYDIVEFDGNYIIRLGCQAVVFGEDLLDKIYSETADMKYKNKEPKKNNVIQLFQPENHDYVISDKIDLDKIKTINFSIDNIDNKE
jgi:hypothetical protein